MGITDIIFENVLTWNIHEQSISKFGKKICKGIGHEEEAKKDKMKRLD